MEHLAAEYNGPVTLILGGVEVAAAADLTAWRGTPAAVDESGAVVYDLDPPTAPRWHGTITITRGAGPPLELPVDSALVVRIGEQQAAAEAQSFEFTLDERLVLHVIGQGPAPFGDDEAPPPGP